MELYPILTIGLLARPSIRRAGRDRPPKRNQATECTKIDCIHTDHRRDVSLVLLFISRHSKIVFKVMGFTGLPLAIKVTESKSPASAMDARTWPHKTSRIASRQTRRSA